MNHMNCPRCQQPLVGDESICQQCELQYQAVDSSLNEVREVIERAEYDSALHSLHQILDEAPRERLAECYALRGFAHLKRGDFSRAEDDCSQSISHDWENPQTYAWRGAARAEMNHWPAAFDDFDQAFQIAGSSRDHYLKLMGSMAEVARDYFKQLIESNQLSADLFYQRGWVNLRLGNSKRLVRAEADFKQSLERQPNHAWAAVGLAETWFTKNPSGHTESVLQLCHTGQAGDAACQRHAWQLAARQYQAIGDLANAKQALERFVSLVEARPHDQVAAAQRLRDLGDTPSSIDLLNRVLESTNDHAPALLTRGDCFAQIRNYHLAEQDFSTYLDLFPRSASALVRRGKNYLAMGKQRRAMRDLQRAVQLQPQRFDAHLYLGKAYLLQGHHDQALMETRQAIQIDNTQCSGYAMLAGIYTELCDFTSAIDEYQRAIQFANDSHEKAEYFFQQGIALYRHDRFDQSLEAFNSSVELRPKHAASWIWQAAAAAALEEWSIAILGLERAILVRPSAAREYQQLGRPVAEKAVRYFDRQLQRGNRSAKLYYQRGLAHQFLAAHSTAIVDFSSVLKLEADNLDALLRRGQSLAETGEFKAAVADFSSAITRDPQCHRAYYRRSHLLFQHEHLDAARKDLAAAIRLDRHHPRYHLLLGEIFERKAEFQKAIFCYDQAILQDPTNPVAYRLRGMANRHLHQYQSATRDFSHAFELAPDQADLLVRRGEMQLKSNHRVTALEDFERALSMDSHLVDAYCGRASILIDQQRFEYALIWVTKAFHRFQCEPRSLARLLISRGQVFYQMKRYLPAVADFGLAIELLRKSPQNDFSTIVEARYFRAIAQIQNQQYDLAVRDLQKILKKFPAHAAALETWEWVTELQRSDLKANDCTLARPLSLVAPVTTQRPTRPPATRTGIEINSETIARWKTDPPFQMWLVRRPDKTEHGPLPIEMLATWASEGRLVNGMQLLRSDWSKWKRIEKIFPEITPLESLPDLVDDFPKLNL